MSQQPDSVDFDSQEEFDLDDDPNELYGVRDGILFIIDATPPMFEKGLEDTEPYFIQCMKQYEDILKQKLSWSRADWMGLVLFGTSEWDQDPETKNILTIHKFSPICLNNLKEVMKITKGKWEHYKEMSSNEAYPLHDILWHAAQMFYSVKLKMTTRKLILFTCRDDPPMLDDNEKHRVRVKVTSFSDIGLQLVVIGMGDSWNHDLFYKDLEMLNGKIEPEDYERTSLKDLVSQVKLSARNMASLPLQLGNNVMIDVSIRNLTVKMSYLKPAYMSLETNAPLTTRTYLQIDETNQEDDVDSGETNSQDLPVLETDVQKYQEFGGRRIHFTAAEVESMANWESPGIQVICAKPISYHPINHYYAPFFVTCGKSYRADNQLLFGLLLDKCTSKNLMLICAVTMRKRSAPVLHTLLPNAEHGGFFLHRIPYEDNVDDIQECAERYMYDDERKPPTTEEGIKLFSKIIHKLRIEYDPDMFPNPKLQTQMKALEALTLDLETVEVPEDKTLPDNVTMTKRIEGLLDEYNSTFPRSDEQGKSSFTAKVARVPIDANSLENEEYIKTLVEKKRLDGCTIPQLKTILKTIGYLKCTGKKEDLLQKIKDHYEKSP